MRALVVAIALVLATALPAVVAPGAATAEAPDARARKLLAAGETLFGEQEYGRAIKVLVAVTRDAAAPRALRVRAWELIALARFIEGDEGGARDAFERLLEADPGFQLRDDSGSPRIRRFFEKIRREVGPAAEASEVDLEHAAPRGAVAGKQLELEIRALRGGDQVREVVVLHRRLGAMRYAEQPARATGDRRWRAVVTLETARRASSLEYYVEARGAGGSVLARIAGPDAPLSIAVAAGGAERRSWASRWYVVTGVAVLAAGATGAILWGATSSGTPEGSLPPGHVTITP